MTPAGLLEGAKSIVSCNKQLRKELKDLEQQVEAVQKQNQFMVSLQLCARHADVAMILCTVHVILGDISFAFSM